MNERVMNERTIPVNKSPANLNTIPQHNSHTVMHMRGKNERIALGDYSLLLNQRFFQNEQVVHELQIIISYNMLGRLVKPFKDDK